MEITASQNPLSGAAKLAAIGAIALAAAMSSCAGNHAAWSIGGATARLSLPSLPVEVAGVRAL